MGARKFDDKDVIWLMMQKTCVVNIHDCGGGGDGMVVDVVVGVVVKVVVLVLM